MAGGKALEKKISGGQTDAYLAYLSALAYQAFVMKRRDMKYVVSALQAAKPMLEISVSDLDRDGFLLNTPDGTYYLPEGLEGRRDHSPEDYITKITAAGPGEQGKDLWLDALDTIFCQDQELIDYVQQIVGMAAIGRVLFGVTDHCLWRRTERQNTRSSVRSRPCAWNLQWKYVCRYPDGGL